MQIKKHTESDARKLARRRFKTTQVNIVAFGVIKTSGDCHPIRNDIQVAYFVESDEHLHLGINPIWESVIYSGPGGAA